jgi:DNA primase
MVAIPEDAVQAIRERVDIVDLVGRYVELRRAGRNYRALCPFHTEKTPSFNVSGARRGYKCFGCGASGDAIRFVMELEGKSFPEAIRKLAELYGVALPSSFESTARDDRRTEKDEAYAIFAAAAEIFRQVLVRGPEGEAGRAYLRARGVEDPTAETFGLGYAPAPTEGGWDFLARTLTKQRHPLELAEKLGLLGRGDRRGTWYDKLRGRLVFPILAPGGETIGFSARIVPPHDVVEEGSPPAPKYVNSPESVVFRKSTMLYGLPTARQAIRAKGRVILVEGNLDVVMLHQRGWAETVAPLGTAFTPEQAHILGRFTDQVVLAFDGDAAGRKAASAALPVLLEEDLDVRIVLLPDGQDPDSTAAERFAALLADARPALEVMMLRLAARAGTAIDARARALDQVLPLIGRLPRASARELYLHRASELFGMPMPRLRAMLAQLSAPSTSRTTVPLSPTVPQATATVPQATSNLPGGQVQLVALLLDAPHLAGVAQQRDVQRYITDERLVPLLEAVLEGASEGYEPTLDELLARIPAAEQPRVYAAVFEAQHGTDTADPTSTLEDLLARCEEERLGREVSRLQRAMEVASRDGDAERVRTLVQEKVAVTTRLQAVRLGRTRGEPAAAPTDPRLLQD